MSDHEDTDLSPEESISDEISERVRSVLAAAESAATAIRHEAEQQVQSKRRAAEAERQRYLEDAKAEAEALLEERMKRISELSDSVIEGAEAVLLRIQGAQEVKGQLESMVHALAAAAQQLADESEAAREAPRPRPLNIEDEPAHPPVRAVPEPEAATVTELRTAEPEPEAEPEVTEAEAPLADAAAGPAEPADLKPVDVQPEAEADPVVEEDVQDAEIVDAVEVVEVDGDEPEPETARRSAAERLRDAGGPDNGAPSKPQRSFEGDDMLAARLVALQMAVAGSARGEVEEHLRVTFEMQDPGAILNDVFGQESKL
jgi:hypothetical protein